MAKENPQQTWKGSWRNIAIALIDAKKGEQTAQACANAC
jgi:hypothetical protein